MEGVVTMALYVWYSAATDVTGKKIQEALKANGGTATPPNTADVLCWGTKIEKNVVLPNKVVYNHPNNILSNRNKANALSLFKKAGVFVADFSEDFTKAGTKDFPFPLVLRTKYHQGGAGFWLCLNKDMVAQAVKEGAQYMQAYLNIKDEYRLHIVNDKVIYAVKKVRRENHITAFKEHFTDYVKAAAVKKKLDLNDDTVDFVLEKLAKKFATGADMIIRSNTRGWKFSKVDVDKLDKNLVDEAIKSIKALGLNYGAVDCCITIEGKAAIIECNTGPGLEGSSFDAWEVALKDLTADKKIDTPVKKAAQAVPEAVKNVGNTKKEQLKKKMALLGDMIEAADTDAELEVVEKLWKKMQKKEA